MFGEHRPRKNHKEQRNTGRKRHSIPIYISFSALLSFRSQNSKVIKCMPPTLIDSPPIFRKPSNPPTYPQKKNMTAYAGSLTLEILSQQRLLTRRHVIPSTKKNQPSGIVFPQRCRFLHTSGNVCCLNPHMSHGKKKPTYLYFPLNPGLLIEVNRDPYNGLL